MKLQLVEASVVVLAQDHNPSILHPSFLASQGIVPEEWQCAEPPICTPAFSVASYTNGIVFTVESHRFQVQDKNPQGNGSTSPVPELAIRYIRKLPYVRYRAVGINLTGFIACPAPDLFLVQRFLTTGPWNGEPLTPKGLALRFLYEAPEASLRLAAEQGAARDFASGETQGGIAVSSNYHRDLPDIEPAGRAVEEVTRLIAFYAERCSHFTAITATVFGLEG